MELRSVSVAVSASADPSMDGRVAEVLRHIAISSAQLQ
jgi:hypothetical protein